LRANAAAVSGAVAAPLVPWTLHDLRRTVATDLQRLGVRLTESDRSRAEPHQRQPRRDCWRLPAARLGSREARCARRMGGSCAGCLSAIAALRLAHHLTHGNNARRGSQHRPPCRVAGPLGGLTHTPQAKTVRRLWSSRRACYTGVEAVQRHSALVARRRSTAAAPRRSKRIEPSDQGVPQRALFILLTTAPLSRAAWSSAR